MTAVADPPQLMPEVGGWRYPYDPGRNPRQQELHACPAQEILFGGSAGPGKTDALLASGVLFCLLVPGATVYLFRRTYKQLEAEIIPRLLSRLPPNIASYNGTKHVFTFSNGAELRLSYLRTEQDLLNFQGVEIHLALWDELTQFTRTQYTYIRTRLRAAGEVREAMAAYGWVPKMIATSNPVGPGHGWVKRMFVDPAPWGQVFLGGVDLEAGEDPAGRRWLAYIPAKASDNPYLDKEAYDNQLAGVDPVLRRAMQDGDWDVLEGVRFSQFRRGIHVIDRDKLRVPLVEYPRAVGADWGMDAPFVALWGALLPDNLVLVYREVYGSNLTAEEQVLQILAAEEDGEREPGRPVPVALDPSCWERAVNNVTRPLDPDAPAVGSVAWFYREHLGGALQKARNARIAGAQLVDHHLRVRGDGLPRLLIYPECTGLIRTLPELLRSKVNPEDVGRNPKQEDHWYDALRYLLFALVGGGVPRVSTEPVDPAAAAATTAAIEQRYDLAGMRSTRAGFAPAAAAGGRRYEA